MRHVSSKKYDLPYWDNFPFDFNRKVKLKEFGDVPNRIVNLLPLKKSDTVVDLGCGAGIVSFLLLLKYNCRVIGIDYSKDAINICRVNKKKFLANNKYSPKQIAFLHKSNKDLKTFKNIKAVYLKDVVEHLYDEEIFTILDTIKKWNKESIYILIHTDNNLYLKYVRPIVDLMDLLLRKTTFEAIHARQKYDAERHINLMTASEVKSKLLKRGFITEKVEYTAISYEKTKDQLKSIGQIKPLLQIVYFFARVLFFLRPSFYLMAQYKKYDNLT